MYIDIEKPKSGMEHSPFIKPQLHPFERPLYAYRRRAAALLWNKQRQTALI